MVDHKVYSEGWHCRIGDGELEYCPYSPEDPEHYSWVMGYADADVGLGLGSIKRESVNVL